MNYLLLGFCILHVCWKGVPHSNTGWSHVILRFQVIIWVVSQITYNKFPNYVFQVLIYEIYHEIVTIVPRGNSRFWTQHITQKQINILLRNNSDNHVERKIDYKKIVYIIDHILLELFKVSVWGKICWLPRVKNDNQQSSWRKGQKRYIDCKKLMSFKMNLY